MLRGETQMSSDHAPDDTTENHADHDDARSSSLASELFDDDLVSDTFGDDPITGPIQVPATARQGVAGGLLDNLHRSADTRRSNLPEPLYSATQQLNRVRLAVKDIEGLASKSERDRETVVDGAYGLLDEVDGWLESMKDNPALADIRKELVESSLDLNRALTAQDKQAALRAGITLDQYRERMRKVRDGRSPQRSAFLGSGKKTKRRTKLLIAASLLVLINISVYLGRSLFTANRGSATLAQIGEKSATTVRITMPAQGPYIQSVTLTRRTDGLHADINYTWIETSSELVDSGVPKPKRQIDVNYSWYRDAEPIQHYEALVSESKLESGGNYSVVVKLAASDGQSDSMTSDAFTW